MGDALEHSRSYLGRVESERARPSSSPSTAPKERPGDLSSEAVVAALADALDHFRSGVLLVGQGGRVVHINAEGRRLVSRLAALDLRGQRLEIDGPASEGAQRLERALDRVFQMQHRWQRGCAELLTLEVSDGGSPIHVCVTAMNAGQMRLGGIFLSSGDQRSEVSDAILRKIFGLTATESRVAKRLVGGLTLGETAAEMGVSVHTCRTHLKKIFEKTRTRRQSELVRVLATGLNILDVEF
jgi:DNA-binding CsgD family transcriptional regulator